MVNRSHRRSATAALAWLAAVVLLSCAGAAGAQAPVRLHAAHDGEPAPAPVPGAAPPVAGAERFLASSTDVSGLAVDVEARKIYWSDYAGNRILRAGFDGSDVEEVVASAVLAPVGVAVVPALGKIYWVTDPEYPRMVQRASIDGSDVEDLVAGEDVNRPGAIAVDAEGGHIYWTEAVNGKVRRAGLDGSSVEDLVDRKVLTSFGIALDVAAGKVYWSDFASGTIERADLDGSEHEEILTRASGIDAPAGIALDVRGRKLYWADQGSEKIRRATLEGWDVEDLVDGADGIVEPQGLALDVDAGKMYWTDATTGKIQRANLDGSAIEDLVDVGWRRDGPARERPPGGPLGDCHRTLDAAADRYVRRSIKALSTCLEKISWVKAVKWRIADEAVAASTCASQLRLVHERAAAAAVLRDAITEACDPHLGDHTLSELLESDFVPGCRRADDGGIDTVAGWVDCAVRAQQSVARAAVSARFPRTYEWLEGIRPFVAVQPAPDDDRERTADALAALDAFLAEVAPPPLHDLPEDTRGRWSLASGQITTYPAVKNDGSPAPAAVPDDGAVGSGGRLRYRDNLDGTVTDLGTGLIWEKKCDRCRGLHDYGQSYTWSGDGRHDTIWDWLDDVNDEDGVGFAGHRDWRIPNVKELVSLVDYQRFNPSVAAAFDGAACGLTCIDITDPDCSCTGMSFYWTSTTFADFPAHAVTVRFNLGLVGDVPKDRRLFVRAVRGGR